MKRVEDHKIKEIDQRLSKLKHVLEGLFPVWNQVDRKVKNLQSEIRYLEDERVKLSEGQMSFDVLNF